VSTVSGQLAGPGYGTDGIGTASASARAFLQTECVPPSRWGPGCSSKLAPVVSERSGGAVAENPAAGVSYHDDQDQPEAHSLLVAAGVVYRGVG